jgi:hypothetical protein
MARRFWSLFQLSLHADEQKRVPYRFSAANGSRHHAQFLGCVDRLATSA